MDSQILDELHKQKETYISGEELANYLKVSRTAVWNHIENLRKFGYIIEAHPRLGYRLTGLPNRLHPDEIKRNLKTKIIGRDIFVYDKTDSTNNIAWELAMNNASEGVVVFSEAQTKGRGRLGRTWFSPKHKGLWFSVVLRPKLQPAYAPMITIAASIAVAKSVMKETGLSALIKWPNDIYIDNKKLGGILTEMRTELDTIKHVILGIGINTNIEKKDFPKELSNKAVSIKCSRIDFAKIIMENLESYYNMLNDKKWDKIMQEWKDMSMVLGKNIKVLQGNKQYEGFVQGIDEKGSLILRTDNGFIEHLNSGEITCF